MEKKTVDRLIFGAGLYGLYSALVCGKKGLSVLVVEIDDAPFKRATYINQARVHMGYHYPRSISTALKSAGYFRRFSEEFDFCIHNRFEQIYATSSEFSWTNATQFEEFCRAADIKCEAISTSRYFKAGAVDGAFLTEEYTYDACILRDYLLDEIEKLPNVSIIYNSQPIEIVRVGGKYEVVISVVAEDYKAEDANLASEGNNPEAKGSRIEVITDFVLNVTYASVNHVLNLIYPDEIFKIKYELCEIILCEAGDQLKNIGITVMDGPFFSIMPFGKTGMHSLTSVTFTPHKVCKEEIPHFRCQEQSVECTAFKLANCNDCEYHPQTAWPYMSHLANKYLLEDYSYEYVKSLYSMKPILLSSEIDDSRPTAIKVHSGGPNGGAGEPTFISVLSGKINTVYDLDEYL